MVKPTIKFPIYDHCLWFNLNHDITLHELKEICLELNGKPLNRSEIGISLPCHSYTPELIHREDIQSMIDDEPHLKSFFKDEYMNGLRSIRFSLSPYSSYWDVDWISQCDEQPDEIFMEKGRGELLFLVDNLKTFEPEGFSDKEYETIKTVLERHGFKFDGRN